MKITTSLTVVLCLITRVIEAQELPSADVERLKQATDRCMAALSKESFANAFQGLFREYWFKPGEAVTQALRLESAYDDLRQRIALNAGGKTLPISHEFLGARHLDRTIVRFVYAQRYENDFLPIGFDFYKARDRFSLAGVSLAGTVSDVLTALTINSPVAGTDSALARLREAVERSVARLSSDEFGSAFTDLWNEYGVKTEATSASILALNSQYGRALKMAQLDGNGVIGGGYEFLGERRLGTFVVRLIYIQKSEQSWLLISFNCHKGKEGWKLTGISLGEAASKDINAAWLITTVK